MESNEGKGYHGKEESQGNNGFLVHEETENVKPTGVDDESNGMTNDDYLGKSNKENRDED
ncbi:hypothetical protein [Spirosoma fluminis]